ncbi:homoserine O-succinyltransferase [Egicoccus sp. AB-alg6-2]|uniref:homoserine O-succinyltransferase MetA n=1 Tax=Egicoccus sp. AB-alg6-2 TaxID=3242692 RepID=UPI00359D4AE3
MPIVAHSSLPTFAELAAAGEDVLDVEAARHADIRELHVGLLNMMPDAALHVTEQQFVRLVGHANRIVQVYVHPFTVPGLVRSDAARAHIERYYTPFEQLREEGLDALIVSGANVSNPRLDEEAFWAPLLEVIDWASDNVTSILCSCLATHALLQYLHGIHRRPLQSKRWGVFPHRNRAPGHPLLHGINTRFDVPHSRWNEVTSAQLEGAGLQVLIESTEGDLHLATSADGIRMVFMQGHPEYDTVSLLKEYKREVGRYADGELDELPPLPQNYLFGAAARGAHRHLEAVAEARHTGRPAPAFPEDELADGLDNTWADTAKAVFANWLGLVYRLTDVERGVAFMPGVDPDDPLGLRVQPPDTQLRTITTDR